MKRFIGTYIAPIFLINLGNASAYAFQILIAHNLRLSELGEFNAVLSSATLLAAPAAAAPLAVTHMALTQQKASGQVGTDAVVSLTALLALSAATIAFVLCASAAPILRHILKISELSVLVNFAGLVAVSLIYPVAAGWLQAKGWYVSMSAILGGAPALRFIFGIFIFYWIKAGVNEAILSVSLSCIVVFIGGLIMVWPKTLHVRSAISRDLLRDVLFFALPAASSATLLYALFNLDMMLVRALQPENESGLYAAAAVIGRIPFLAPAAAANALFGELRRRDAEGLREKRRRILYNVAGVATLGLALAAAIAIFAEPLILTLAGGRYLPAAPLLRLYSFAMAGLGMLNTVVVLGMTTKSVRPLLVLAAGVVAFALVSVGFATTTYQIILTLTVAIYSMFGVCMKLVLDLLAKGDPSQIR